ncbi:MAG TPA: hypothetical protein VD864_01360 [Nocardioides sp.]|nr:hypothetical protein [Nocardioides sp.]
MRWLVIVVLTAHGLIHLMGAAKGFGWAEMDTLKEPIGTSGAVMWLLAAALVLATAGMIVAGAPNWWWAVAAVAAVLSQTMVFSSWGDAKAGTIANLLLLAAAGYGLASTRLATASADG